MAGPTTEILASDLKELTGEVQALRGQFAEFRGEAKAVFSILKWLGSFLAFTLIGVIGALLTLTWYASKVDSRVAGLETATIAQSSRLDRLEQAAVAQSSRLDRLEKSVERLSESVEKLVKVTGREAAFLEANPTDDREGEPETERVSADSSGDSDVN